MYSPPTMGVCVLFSDHSDVALEKNLRRSTDSDNEEFCDSMEHLAMDEVCFFFCLNSSFRLRC